MKSAIKQAASKISTVWRLIVGIGLGSVVFVGCADETFSVTAKDYEELRDTGMIQRYWLPDTMPKSVRDVKFSGDVENGSGSGTFFVSPDDIDDLTKGFDLVTPRQPRTWLGRVLGAPDSEGVIRYVRERDSGAALPKQVERITVNTTTGFVQWSTK